MEASWAWHILPLASPPMSFLLFPGPLPLPPQWEDSVSSLSAQASWMQRQCTSFWGYAQAPIPPSLGPGEPAEETQRVGHPGRLPRGGDSQE